MMRTVLAAVIALLIGLILGFAAGSYVFPACPEPPPCPDCACAPCPDCVCPEAEPVDGSCHFYRGIFVYCEMLGEVMGTDLECPIFVESARRAGWHEIEVSGFDCGPDPF